MPITMHFTEEDWQRIERDWKAWWAGELDRPLLTLEVTEPQASDCWSHLTRYGLETPIEQILDDSQRFLETTWWMGDAYPKWWVNFGAGVMAAFLGSKLTWRPDTTWFWPLERVTSLEEIQPHYEADAPWWVRVRETTRQAVERWAIRCW